MDTQKLGQISPLRLVTFYCCSVTPECEGLGISGAQFVPLANAAHRDGYTILTPADCEASNIFCGLVEF